VIAMLVGICQRNTGFSVPGTNSEDGEIVLQLNKPHTKGKPNESWGRKARYLTQML